MAGEGPTGRTELGPTYRRRRLVALIAMGAIVALIAYATSGGGDDPDGDAPPAAASSDDDGQPAAALGSPAPFIDDDPESLLVLVNHDHRLPPGWVAPDLVVPAVAFTFSGDDPKRLLRAPAARALEVLMAAATADGLPLAVVSGYRSEERQNDLYQAAVAQAGEPAGVQVAPPGFSEHQTGLAVDLTGADGACPAEACFAGTPEARWLAAHAAEHGFVVRYPEGKEALTGYEHEPWHLRYLGPEAAQQVAESGLVLEQLPRRIG